MRRSIRLVPRKRAGRSDLGHGRAAPEQHRRPRARDDAPAPVGEERLRPGRPRLRGRDLRRREGGHRRARVRGLLPRQRRGLPGERRGGRRDATATPRARPRRPIARGDLSPRTALLAAVLATLVAFGLVAVTNWQTVVTLRRLPGAPGRLLLPPQAHPLRGHHGDRHRVRPARVRRPDLDRHPASRSGCSCARASSRSSSGWASARGEAMALGGASAATAACSRSTRWT